MQRSREEATVLTDQGSVVKLLAPGPAAFREGRSSLFP
jgi:hypothetical protein